MPPSPWPRRARRAQRAVPRSGRLGGHGDVPARPRAGARGGVPGARADRPHDAPRRAARCAATAGPTSRGSCTSRSTRGSGCGGWSRSRSRSARRLARRRARRAALARVDRARACPRTRSVRDAARRHVLPHAHVRRGDHARHAGVAARRAHGADALIAVSAAARDEICAVLGLDPARFTVVPHGAGRPRGRPAAPVAEVARRARPGRAPGRALRRRASAPHKNQRLLVAALPELPGRRRARARRARTRRPPRAAALARHLRRGGPAALPGYLPDAELEALWRARRLRRVPDARRGLRAAGARGDAARRARRLLGPPGAARGRRRRAALLRARTTLAAAARAIAAAMDDARGARGPGGPRRAFTWAAAARGTFAAYERALA